MLEDLAFAAATLAFSMAMRSSTGDVDVREVGEEPHDQKRHRQRKRRIKDETAKQRSRRAGARFPASRWGR